MATRVNIKAETTATTVNIIRSDKVCNFTCDHCKSPTDVVYSHLRVNRLVAPTFEERALGMGNDQNLCKSCIIFLVEMMYLKLNEGPSQ